MFIMPQMHCPLYTLFEVLYIINHLFLYENVGSLSHDLCLLFKLPGIVQEMHQRQSVQAAWWNGKQAGSWISRLRLESSGGSLYFSGLLLLSPSRQGPCGFFNCLEGREDHKASGLPWNSVFTSTRHFGPSAFSQSQLSRYLSLPWGQETLQKRDDIWVTENQTTAAVSPTGGKTWTD